MRNYPNTLKRKLLEAISQLREELPRYTQDLRQNDALQFRFPASAAYLFYAAKGEAPLPRKRCFCRAHCAGVSARICVCGQCGDVDRKFAASYPVRTAQATKYAGETPGQLSVPNDLRFLHLFFAEETPRFWRALFENLHVCKAGSGRKSRSLFLREAYLNEIRLSRRS